MLTRLSAWFYKISTAWVTLLFAGVFILFTAFVLPDQTSQAEEDTGGGFTPDTSFFYTPSQLYQAAEAYGPAGRQAFIHGHFTFDLAWPLIYTACLITSVSWLLAHSLASTSRWRLLNLLPLAAMVIDLLENIAASLVIYRYPAATLLIDWLAPFFTMLKWISIAGCLALLVGGMIMAIRQIARSGSVLPLP